MGVIMLSVTMLSVMGPVSTLEKTGIFITLAVNYRGIWSLENVGFLQRQFTMVNYRSIFIRLAPGEQLEHKSRFLLYNRLALECSFDKRSSLLLKLEIAQSKI
jgi:hypothetical protein